MEFVYNSLYLTMGNSIGSDYKLLNKVTYLPEKTDTKNITTKEATITNISDNDDYIRVFSEPQIYADFMDAPGVRLLKTHPNFDELLKKLIPGHTYKFTYKYSTFGYNILVNMSESTKYESIGIVKGFINHPNDFYWKFYYEIIIGGDCEKTILIHRNKMSDVKLDKTYKFICDKAYNSKYYKVVDYEKIDI